MFDEALSTKRRNILAMAGTVAAAGFAGCSSEEPATEIDPVQNRVTVNPDEIVTGGTLNVGLVLEPDTFDQPNSVEAPATLLHNLFWESLLTTDATGSLYPWLSREYELVDIQDVEASEYTPYMRTAPIERPEDSLPFIDVDEQIVVTHPDTDRTADDEAQVLTVADTGDAVADDVYGMHFQHVLEEGIEFHNGEELTAETVVRSYELWEQSATAGQVFDQFLHAEAVDTYTVDIYAQYPDAEAVDDILWPIYPTEHIDNGIPDEGPVVGTGPWEWVEYEPGSHLIVEKTDEYWLETIGLDAKDWWDGPADFPEAPVIDRIDMAFIPDESTRGGALETGEIDLTADLTATQRTNFDAHDDFRVSRTSGGSYVFFQFPLAVEPFDNPLVRRAANHLIPRTDIVNEVKDGWANEAWVPLPQFAAETGTTDYETLEADLREYNEYNPERADELIEEADVDTPIDVTIQTIADNDDRVRAGEIIVEAFNQSDHFTADLDAPGDLTTMVSIWFEPDYHQQGNIVMISLSGTFNPQSFCETIHHPDHFNECCNGNIPPGALPPDFIDLMESAQFGVDVAEDPALRRERYDDVWHRFVDLNANSVIDFELETATFNDTVLHGFNQYPFSDGLLSYGLYNPPDQQITYIDRV